MTITLYKKGVDPIEVVPEALDFHLLQGWVEDPEDVDEDETVVAPPLPFIVGKADPVADSKSTLCELCASKDLQIAGLTEKIEDLEEVVEAQQKTITGLRAAALSPTPVDPTRVAAIKVAIDQIPQEKWNKATAGRPEMPLLGDIAAITGFSVNSAEVVAVITA